MTTPSKAPRGAPPLLLVAAGGLAREVLAMVHAHALYDVIGFIDDSPALANQTIDGVRVLGSSEIITTYTEAQILVCAGRGAVRERIVTRFELLDVSPARFATAVHPSVEIPDGCHVGAGSIVLGGVVMTTAVTLGRHVVVMPNVTLTHDCRLQDYATVCAGVTLGGKVEIGHAAYVGMNASVREGVTVRSNATLGMGSVLLTDAGPHETWVGAPARPLPPKKTIEQ
ncbi:MAG: NeuD/PglB/VioB family sugar acetyltransferase [Hyphomonadaceae bacterium]|nr:NeuD/PglB/VioB family sugar acetyltransferase [Hyphomonadaceae bacterium]